MKKISNILQVVLLGGFFVAALSNSAHAFGWIPPMPPDIEVDIPGNAGKVVSQVKAAYRQYQTVMSYKNSLTLDNIKKGVLLNLSSFGKGSSAPEAKQKTPGRWDEKYSTELGLNENNRGDEAAYMNAYHKLFFVYPMDSFKNLIPQLEEKGAGKNYTGGPEILQVAYRRKAVEYRQDVIVDTYLSSRLTESYLELVEKTINRLERCQNGLEADMDKNCVFWNLKMVKVESVENPEDLEGKDSTGQMGMAMNAYIETVVYDRLMRIIEDLTATEAIYRAAKQIELTMPVTPSMDRESNADDYLIKTFDFAYHNEYATAHASMLSKEDRSDCIKSGGKNCPGYNKEPAEIEIMEDTEILTKLKPIEDKLNRALLVHNLKALLPEYKTEYRKYLKKKELHERALKALQQSDKCVSQFLSTYRDNGDSKAVKETQWGAPSEFMRASGYEALKRANDYEKRTGISEELIRIYQKNINAVIIGSSPKCDDYYETCPDGYRLDTTQNCQILDDSTGEVVSEDKNLHPCILDTVEMSSDDAGISGLDNDNSVESVTGKINSYDAEASSTYSDADYLKDSSMADKIDNDNRIKAEQTWQIGAAKIMKLTENGYLKFAPWNDQQVLQEEYLHHKYGNIKMIVQSTDIGMNAFKIAASKVEGSEYSNAKDSDVKSSISPLVTAITRCLPAGSPEAQQKAKEAFCTESSASLVSCVASGDSGSGKITVTKKLRDSDGSITTSSVTYNQIVSTDPTKCTFTTTPHTWDGSSSVSSSCNATDWDFMVSSLVEKYFAKVLGGCKANINSQAQYLYNTTHNGGKGRIVAQSKLNDVVQRRIERNNMLRVLVNNYNTIQSANENKLKAKKAQIKAYNEKIDAATKIKNIAKQEQKRTEERIADDGAINTEINTLDASIKENKDLDKAYTCGLELKKMQLEYEREAIKGKKNGEIAWSCPKSCQEIKKTELCPSKAPDVSTYLVDLNAWTRNPTKIDDIHKYVTPDVAKAVINKQNTVIASQKTLRDVLKEQIKTLQEEIEKAASEFTDDYLEMAEDNQKSIEEVNEKFEEFVKKDDAGHVVRMQDGSRTVCTRPSLGFCTKRGPKTYESDNLATTIPFFITDTDDLKESVRQSINDKLLPASTYTTLANKLGIGGKFKIDNTIKSLGFDLNAGAVTAAQVVEKVKDAIVEMAVDEIVSEIKKADKIMQDELDNAKQEVESVINTLGVETISTTTPSATQKSIIASPQNYTYGGRIGKLHQDLINKLKTPVHGTELAQAGLKIEDILGIPAKLSIAAEPDRSESAEKDDTIAMEKDSDYFAGLPARGVNYLNKASDDLNAGRDYRAPRGPLLNLPPLREVFYFSAMDYTDLSPKKADKPKISTLLDVKYPGDIEHQWEYLPEVWRYLLAHPNMRDDGKYQNTFIERSLAGNELKSLIPNDDNGYATVIARAGVYPCYRNSNAGKEIIDINGNNNVGRISFATRKNVPTELSALPTCQEIAYNKVPGTACYTYNSKRNGICHLLADHGVNRVEDAQTKLGSSNNSIYKTYSELGQFLKSDLRYRPLQRNIQLYLTDSNANNDINRQKAEVASFKRNVFGSFLEAVNAEHSTHKALDNSHNDVMKALKSMCGQLMEFVDNANFGETEDTCAQYIMSHGGLAYSAEDTSYGVSGEYRDNIYNGIKCTETSKSNYELFYCELDSIKDGLVAEADKLFKDMQQKYRKDISKVQERVDNMDTLLQVLRDVDKDEVAYLPPETSVADAQNKVNTAKADKTAARKTDDQGIKSLDNQGQVVPYCPTYIYK